jgi:hypothetical protein
VEGVNSNMIYLIYCKKFCKCHNIPSPSTTVKKKKKGKHEQLNIPNIGYYGHSLLKILKNRVIHKKNKKQFQGIGSL